MAIIQPPGNRSTIKRAPDSLTITIPVQRSGPNLVFPVVFSFVGGMLLWLSLSMVAPSRYHRVDASDWLMVVMAFVAIGFAVYLVLWTFAGREIIVVRPGLVRRRLEMFGLGFDREYDAAHVVNLRAAMSPTPPTSLRCRARAG